MLRTIIVALLGIFAGMVLTYIAVVGGTAVVWDLAGVHDQDGGGMMALGLVIAPVIALIGGLVCAFLAVAWDARRRDTPTQTPEARAQDTYRLFIAGGAIAGAMIGHMLGGLFFYYTGLIRLDYLLAAWLPTILTLLGALVGGWQTRRWLKRGI